MTGEKGAGWQLLIKHRGGNYQAHLAMMLAPYGDSFEPSHIPVHGVLYGNSE